MDPVFFRQRTDALAALFGPADPTIHTALPPVHLGGGVDVRRFAGPDGVTYVTAGLTDPSFPQATPSWKYEIALRTRAPAEWAPKLLSALGPHTARLHFAPYGTVPLGDGPGRIGGLLFAPHPGFRAADRSFGLRMAVAVTAEELTACRAAGGPSVIAGLEAAGIHPCSDPDRSTLPRLAALVTAPPWAALRAQLGPDADAGVEAVLQAASDDVEAARDGVTDEDVPVLAQLYFHLPSWIQRIGLVLLTQDHTDAALEPVWRHALGMPEPEEHTEEHAALAVAVSGLEGDTEAFPAYFDDLAVVLARAAELRATPSPG